MAYLKRAYYRIRRYFYKKRFAECSIYALIGSNGCGKGCKISGCKYISIGDRVLIEAGSEIVALEKSNKAESQAKIVIGNDTRIHSGCRITAAKNIIIGKNALLAPEVFITDHNHGMNPEIEEGYARQELIIKPVRIGDGTWIGQRAIILPGVSVGKHSIIGAGSICTKDIPDYSMVAGVPAKVIKRWDKIEKQWMRV